MSRFISEGGDPALSEQDDAWTIAQQKINANKQAKSELGKQEGGKTLYETLQANKGLSRM